MRDISQVEEEVKAPMIRPYQTDFDKEMCNLHSLIGRLNGQTPYLAAAAAQYREQA